MCQKCANQLCGVWWIAPTFSLIKCVKCHIALISKVWHLLLMHKVRFSNFSINLFKSCVRARVYMIRINNAQGFAIHFQGLSRVPIFFHLLLLLKVSIHMLNTSYTKAPHNTQAFNDAWFTQYTPVQSDSSLKHVQISINISEVSCSLFNFIWYFELPVMSTKRFK